MWKNRSWDGKGAKRGIPTRRALVKRACSQIGTDLIKASEGLENEIHVAGYQLQT